MTLVLVAWTRLDAVSVLLALAVLAGLAARFVLTPCVYLTVSSRAMSLARFNSLCIPFSRKFNDTILEENKK